MTCMNETANDKCCKTLACFTGSTCNVFVFPGERMDVVVRASQESGGYWIRVQGSGACKAVTASAMLLYSGFNYTSMLQANKVRIFIYYTRYSFQRRIVRKDPWFLSARFMSLRYLSFSNLSYRFIWFCLLLLNEFMLLFSMNFRVRN